MILLVQIVNVQKENTVINTAYAIKQNVNGNERVVHVRVNVNSIKNVNIYYLNNEICSFLTCCQIIF